MKEGKRHISTEKKLIIGIIISILISIILVYIYNNYFVGRTIKDNVLLIIVVLLVILIYFVSSISSMVLFATLLFNILYNYETKRTYLRSKEQIKALPNDFVNVHFKNFDNFPLSKFVPSEEISCIARRNSDGKIEYRFQLTVEFHETDDYSLFLKHFDI